jgi:hypothetical protein
MTMGAGAVTSISGKQGMNTQSSTKAEVIAADELVGSMVWTRLFLEAQGYPVKDNILYQDNKSAMLLEEKGKRSIHLNIWLFFVKDQKDKDNISIQYCPTNQMIGDYMMKPLHSKKFEKFWQSIMDLPCAAQLLMAAFVENTSEMAQKKKRKEKETSVFKVCVFTCKKIELNERMLSNRSIGQQECVVNGI